MAALARWWGGPILVFARSRGAIRAVAVLGASLGAAVLVTPEPVPVQFRAAAVGLGPVVAALPGVFFPTLLEHPEPRMEPTRAPRVVLLRCAWLALLAGAFTAVGAIAVGGGAGAVSVSARSLAFTAGLGLLVAQVTPALAAWLPSAVLLAVTLVYGTISMSGRPYRWALLLYPQRSQLAAAVAGALLVTGSVLYVLRDSRSSR